MKTSITLTLVAAFSLVAAQGPEPTESYGCEPHGDHWHCEGPITTTTAPTTTSVAPTTTSGVIVISTTAADDHNDHDDEDHTDHPASTGASMAPSPTESIGCEPHGDHWHCDGARSTTPGGAVITSAPASTLTTAAVAGNSTSTGAQSSTLSGAANVRNAGLSLVGGLLVLPFALTPLQHTNSSLVTIGTSALAPLGILHATEHHACWVGANGRWDGADAVTAATLGPADSTCSTIGIRGAGSTRTKRVLYTDGASISIKSADALSERATRGICDYDKLVACAGIGAAGRWSGWAAVKEGQAIGATAEEAGVAVAGHLALFVQIRSWSTAVVKAVAAPALAAVLVTRVSEASCFAGRRADIRALVVRAAYDLGVGGQGAQGDGVGVAAERSTAIVAHRGWQRRGTVVYVDGSLVRGKGLSIVDKRAAPTLAPILNTGEGEVVGDTGCRAGLGALATGAARDLGVDVEGTEGDRIGVAAQWFAAVDIGAGNDRPGDNGKR
ncbi:hypothetical protein V500_03143 [Pseudogymnoascus sp. VKM F-4518 (FW-2643)]|nr:hypothetical protein V500_03143 [Pseudogymnoascus sp. VKM F-4518 (FW-2643)]